MTSSDYFGVSLQIWHPEQTPDQISKAMGVQATFAGLKGTTRGPAKSSSATWKENYWCDDSNDGDTVEERIESIARYLVPKERQLAELLETGGRAEIYVFLAPSSSLAFSLDGKMLESLGRLGVQLGVEVHQAGHGRASNVGASSEP
jgi:hypothetical protein